MLFLRKALASISLMVGGGVSVFVPIVLTGVSKKTPNRLMALDFLNSPSPSIMGEEDIYPESEKIKQKKQIKKSDKAKTQGTPSFSPPEGERQGGKKVTNKQLSKISKEADEKTDSLLRSSMEQQCSTLDIFELFKGIIDYSQKEKGEKLEISEERDFHEGMDRLEGIMKFCPELLTEGTTEDQ